MVSVLAPKIVNFSDQVASFAVEALLAEVNLTPKPALVDRRGSGAHDDLTLALMQRSAQSLHSMFMEMAQAAIDHGILNQSLRETIGQIGRDGEQTMLEATSGVNTHRGAIWALGLLVTAAGYLHVKQQRFSARHLCQIAGKIACIHDRFSQTNVPSHGQMVKQKYGAHGAKYQAQQGFPAILNHGLPQLLESRARGGNEEFAQLDALLAMMSVLDDTCVLYRAGEAGLYRMQQGASEVLTLGGVATFAGRRKLYQLEKELLSVRASAGGAADLLAATILICHLEQMY